MKPGVLVGTVVDERGRPEHYASVTVRGPSLPEAEADDVDDAGRFELDGLPAGTYELTVRCARRPVVVAPGKRTVVDVVISLKDLFCLPTHSHGDGDFASYSSELDEDQVLTGRIVDDRRHEPVEGVEIELRGVGLSAPARQRTNRYGRYWFVLVPDGDYRLTAHMGARRVEVSLAIRARREPRDDLMLTDHGSRQVAPRTGAANPATPRSAPSRSDRLVESARTCDGDSFEVCLTLRGDAVGNIATGEGGFRTYESVMNLPPGAAVDELRRSSVDTTSNAQSTPIDTDMTQILPLGR